MSEGEHPFSQILNWYRHRCEKTLAQLDRDIRDDPNNAAAYYRRGMLHYNNKQYEAAIEDWRIAYELGGMEFYRLKFWIRDACQDQKAENIIGLPAHFPVFSANE